MLDGQGCLLPVRHFHREDTPLMLSSWSGLYTTCRVEASAENSPRPNPIPTSPHSPSLVACICSTSSEVESAQDSHGELLNRSYSKPCHCSTASHLEAERVWDFYGELAAEGTMPCTSSEFDCSSTSPSRSAQAFSFFPDQEAETDPAQTWSSRRELEELDARPCLFLKGDCRSTEPSRSSDAEVESNKIAIEEGIFLESAGAVSSSIGQEEICLSRCENSEDSIDKVMKSGGWLKRNDIEALECEENQTGATDNYGISEDHRRYPEDKEPYFGSGSEESEAKDSKETYGNSSFVEGNTVEENQTGAIDNYGITEDHIRYPKDKETYFRSGSDESEVKEVKDSKETYRNSSLVEANTVLKRNPSGSASTLSSSRFVGADGKGCKRLRVTNSDEISCGAFAESITMFAKGPAGQVACNSHDNDLQQQPYLPGLDDESALRCLAFVPLFDLGRLAMVGKRYRDLVKSRDFFKLRRTYGMVEHLVFIYTSGTDVWTAYDAKQNVWRTLPPANVNTSFETSDKESLSAGTHVLWLGKVLFEFVYYRYDLVTNNWERGPSMVNPRCLFASASCGEFAFVAGGFGSADNNGALSLLNSAERYSSLTGMWEPLPPMSIRRHKCSGFFMDGKFYVIGGRDENHQPIMSGEEYNPATGVWRTIPNMYFTPEVARRDMCEPSPPLVAVVNNQLYAVENTTNVLKMYNKHNNTWIDLGPLPVRAHLRNGWGVAFKALGNWLFVMGDADGIAAFCWRPGPNATKPVWQRLYRRERGTSFLFNCAVMAC